MKASWMQLMMVALLVLACREKRVGDAADTTPTDSVTVDEFVSDSLSLGKRGDYKVNVRRRRTADDEVMASFELFMREGDAWKRTQQYEMHKDGITSLDVTFSDFNNDGLRDMTFVSGIAVRGANEIRTLFLFDSIAKQLKPILNSSDFPNLRYNAELNCLDSWMIYGGSATVFLKIEGDSLREFGGVELFENRRTIYEMDEEGNKSILQQDEIDDLDVLVRYKSFYPALPDVPGTERRKAKKEK